MLRVILFLLFAILNFFIIMPVSAQNVPDPTFQKKIASDAKYFSVLRSNLQRAVEFTRSRPDLFGSEVERGRQLMTHEEKLVVWGTWSSLLDSIAGLDSLRREHKKFDLLQESGARNASFAIANAAFLAGYRFALEFIVITDRNPALDTILNEPVPELGLPAGSFSRFKFRFLNAAIASEFAALQVVSKAGPGGASDVRSAIDDDSRAIWEMGKGRGHVMTLKNALVIVRKSGFSAWFPLQKGVSEWMGDTKVARPHSHLISNRQVVEMGRRLQPGDIIFERHEWYLSNLGLPGFWTHVALYIGTPEERRVFFNDPGVRDWVRGLGIADGSFENLLRQRFMTAYSRSQIPKEDKHPVRILESISEGVAFTSLEYTGSADSIAVIRPRLSKRDKAHAIMRAFYYSGRPYDFNFDFETDAALVCSELIFKAYEPGNGMKGMRFPVTEVMGRKVSTPNNMVRQFAEQSGGPGPQADFVLFLDGFEKQKRALDSTEEQFHASWRRPNWHILVQDAPVEVKRK